MITVFQGAALAFQASLGNELFLILAAIVTVYIVLGVLYESFIHPITILSTLPSAGVGALLALMIAGNDLTVIAIIGIILLIGIVKKNAIMMIDFALDAERNEGKAPREAIYQACLLRFRPILMTTMAALFGALPLMLGTGTGSELRHPLGITIVGGLIVSQVLTLFTTPVIYLWLRPARRRLRRQPGRRRRRAERRPVNPSAPFIRRPVATTLLTIGLALAGVFAFFKLPVAPLPQVDFPTISVQATLPGASPDTMATTVATPLERHLGMIADVTEMTSSSTVGTTRITLQFDLDRDIDGAARDVQAAINAARADLPTSLRQNPTYRKVNPADAPILILALTSDTLTRGQIYDAASTVHAAETVADRRHRPGRDQRQLAAGGAGRAQSRRRCSNTASASKTCAPRSPRPTPTARRARIEDGDRRYQIYTNDQANHAADYKPLIVAYRNGAAVRLTDVGEVTRLGRESAQSRPRQRQAGGAGHPLPPARRQHHRHRRSREGDAAAIAGLDPARDRRRADDGPHDHDPHLAARCRTHAVDRDRARHPRGLRVPARTARDADPERGGAGVADRHLRRDVPAAATASTICR